MDTSPTPLPNYKERLTLRRLIELIGDEYLDVPISVRVSDPYGNNDFVTLLEDWPQRAKGQPEYGDPGRLILHAPIGKALVKRAKK